MLLFIVLITPNIGHSQCTVGCDVTYYTCTNIASISATNGTAADNHIICISPPAGCGVITIGNVQLGQYERLAVCTNSSTDTVKFIGNFAASGGGGSAANDNTRFFDIYGNVQFTYGTIISPATVTWGSRMVINVASTGTLDLRPSLAGPNPVLMSNSDSIIIDGKFLSNGPITFSGPVSNRGSIDAASISVSGGIENKGTINSWGKVTLNSGANVINDGNITSTGSFTSSSGSFFDNNGYWYAKASATFSGSYSNNSYFLSDGKLTLNASGTLDIKNGIFESDSLILNSGTLSAGTGCAVFKIHRYSSIQSSGASAIPSGAVAILDLNNPGQIDNVACGCGSTDADQIDNAVTMPSGTQCSGPATANATGPYCGIIPISSLSAGGACFTSLSSLPVTWINYSAKQLNDQQIKIEWTTAQEIDNAYFTVQRSHDGINFENVGKVNGSGNSPEQHTYVFVDNFHYKGVVFYRLEQTDFNGKINYSDITAVSCSDHRELNFDVFPNPATSNNEINLSVAGLEENSEIVVVLMDHLGKSIYTKAFITENNDILVAFGSEMNLAKGVYFISASSHQSIVTKKLVVD